MAKIIEGMKRLKVIDKRMETNTANISKYSSMLSTERTFFESEAVQRREVKSLIQSNEDLMNEYLALKGQIERTNLSTNVEMGGRQYTISDLLVIKRRLAQKMISTFNGLNEQSASARLRSSMSVDGKAPQVVRLFDEKDRNDGLSKWHDLYDNIESRLEVINATTDLVE